MTNHEKTIWIAMPDSVAAPTAQTYTTTVIVIDPKAAEYGQFFQETFSNHDEAITWGQTQARMHHGRFSVLDDLAKNEVIAANPQRHTVVILERDGSVRSQTWLSAECAVDQAKEEAEWESTQTATIYDGTGNLLKTFAGRRTEGGA